jgi:hypothetical protein
MKKIILRTLIPLLLISSSVSYSLDNIREVIPNIDTIPFEQLGGRISGNLVVGKNTIGKIPSDTTFFVEKGKITIKEGSLLYILNGGKLVVDANSELILEKGALIWDDGIIECYGKCVIDSSIYGTGKYNNYGNTIIGSDSDATKKDL